MPSPFVVLAAAEPNPTFAIARPAQHPSCGTMCDVATAILLTAAV